MIHPVKAAMTMKQATASLCHINLLGQGSVLAESCNVLALWFLNHFDL